MEHIEAAVRIAAVEENGIRSAGSQRASKSLTQMKKKRKCEAYGTTRWKSERENEKKNQWMNGWQLIRYTRKLLLLPNERKKHAKFHFSFLSAFFARNFDFALFVRIEYVVENNAALTIWRTSRGDARVHTRR